jgi:flagellar protein FliS
MELQQMNGYNQYQNNQIATASREQILLMLYDGAIRFCRQAEQAIKKDDIPAKGKFIGKAIAIISEFSDSLDHEVGGEIAENLDALYAYMLKELTTANIKNDPEPIDTVCTLLSDLRATWSEAIEINNSQHVESSNNKLRVMSI